jgi:hypothetical protein
MRREVLHAMQLASTNWLLDPEMLVKAHYLGVRVLELNVFARMRGNGLSHVRLSTCWEFFKHLLRMRFSGELNAWRQSARPPVIQRTQELVPGTNDAASHSPAGPWH